MNITELSVKRPIATTMVFLIIIVVGIMGFRFLPVDLLPPIEYPMLSISTTYPNVGPEEIETIITDRVENAIASVPNIEEIRSNSSEGRSRVTLEFTQGTNIDEAANDVRAALDRIRGSLPPEVEPPRLWKFDPDNFPVVILGARSNRNMEQLTRILEREISQRFEQVPGVGSVDVWGGVYREIQIQLKRDRLASGNLTATDVANALRQENITLPGGDMREGISDMYVRTRGEYQSVNQIGSTIITVIDGKPIRVQDVAEVVDGYEDLNRVVQIDGLPMIRMGIRKQSGANTVAVAAEARKIMDKINGERDDLELLMVIDQSEFIQGSINNVQKSALWGGLLAIFILYIFLRNGSTTFIIALSIPISLIATFGLLYFNDLTLNQMSFGGLALGIGLIVDNAIVVLENIVRLRENKESLEKSALVGTKQVAGAIIASTLTTSVIFLPVIFMQTVSGMLFKELALVVVFALLCSLLVALTLVPMLSSRFLTVGKGEHATDDKQSRLGRMFLALENKYSGWLEAAVHHRKTVLGITAALLVGTILLWPMIPVELAPQTDADEIDVGLQMAQGTNIAVVNKYLYQLEQLVKEVTPMDQVEHMSIEIRPGDAEVELSLKPSEIRTVNSFVLADQIREHVSGKIPGGEVRVSAQSGLWMLRRLFGSGGSEAVQIELRGYDLALADQLAADIEDVIEQMPEVADIRISRREGRPEQNLIIDREKIADLGLSVSEIARVIQTNIGGSRAGVYREGGEEFPIMVRLQPEDRLSTVDIKNISVRTRTGRILPISSVVQTERRRSPTSIERINGQRVTYITANLESGIALGDVVRNIQMELGEFALPVDFSLVFSGEYEEQQKAQRDFTLSILMAIILIYMVMAAQFERFLDPLIVMVSVPLAIIGVVPTLLITGTSLNIQSLMGIVMLIGIVVNNAIVLVDYINLMRREQNLDITEAVLQSGRLRLRPILMTAATTILGMLPLSFGTGAGGEIQAALARAVIGGLTVSTLITLILIPVVYITTHNLLDRVRA
ncbi:MAG: efflux RND transporter permease subunit [Candidatus Marinimicrobia bacterium]|nr:efflux RND transporter permease subunit [Candidatus Neomarinimicrobiota bacterium]MCF7829400.1 efflux RND transporter permease subunit [Candidatus Neomarinimicrobiota bacterium]MCF7880886.1 efflux RND transporter permease subunit [Candidatus Neomarinimicrobiota bacterium]